MRFCVIGGICNIPVERDGAAADDVGEPSTSYPEPPERVFRASDLFGEAAVLDAALWLAASEL